MTREQKQSLAEILAFRFYLQLGQTQRMIDYAYEQYHSGGIYEVMQGITDILYIFTGRYDIGASELLEIIS